MPDYTAMNGPDIIRECGDSGSKWGAAFRQHAEKLGHTGMDEGWIMGWFCNAIEGACDTRRWRAAAAARQPDLREQGEEP